MRETLVFLTHEEFKNFTSKNQPKKSRNLNRNIDLFDKNNRRSTAVMYLDLNQITKDV